MDLRSRWRNRTCRGPHPHSLSLIVRWMRTVPGDSRIDYPRGVEGTFEIEWPPIWVSHLSLSRSRPYLDLRKHVPRRGRLIPVSKGRGFWVVEGGSSRSGSTGDSVVLQSWPKGRYPRPLVQKESERRDSREGSGNGQVQCSHTRVSSETTGRMHKTRRSHTRVVGPSW